LSQSDPHPITPSRSPLKPTELSGSNLAFLGDAVLSLHVRTWLLEEGHTRAGELQRLSIGYVNAHAQARFMHTLLEEGLLTPEELDIYKRGRNSHTRSHARNADIVTYRVATGLEALLGYWHLTDPARLTEILEKIKSNSGNCQKALSGTSASGPIKREK
jgi:ribonuclease-3 family protein